MHRYELRAFRIPECSSRTRSARPRRKPRFPVLRPRTSSSSGCGAPVRLKQATAQTKIQVAGDVLAVAGPRDALVQVIGHAAEEVEDPELLAIGAEGVDIYVTSRDADGKTLAELAQLPVARGVFLRKIVRGATATEIPVLPNTQIHRGDDSPPSSASRASDTAAAAKALGYADPRPTDVTDVAFVGAAIAVGPCSERSSSTSSAIPLTLSTAGGVRSADQRPHLRLAALRASDIRPNSVTHSVVHELGRPERVHRGGRIDCRTRVCCGHPAVGNQPVPVGVLRRPRCR